METTLGFVDSHRRYTFLGTNFREKCKAFTLKTTDIIFRLASVLKCVPFEPVNSGGTMQVRPYESKLALIPWHCVNAIVYLNFALRCTFFLSSFTRKTLESPDESDGVEILSLIFAGMSTLFMSTLYSLPHDGIRLLNQHAEFVTLITGTLQVRHWASYDYVILTLNYCFAACSGLPALMTLRFYLAPRQSQYLFYHLELLLPGVNGNWLLPCCIVYEYMWFLWAGIIISLFYVYWCADIFTMNSIQRVLCKDTRRLQESDVNTYVYLQIFCNTFNQFNGLFYTVGFNFLLVTLSVASLLISLESYDNMHILMYLCFPATSIFCGCVIFCFCTQHALVWILSEKVLHHLRVRFWQRKGQISRGFSYDGGWRTELILHKKIRALRRIGIEIGFFGPYTAMTCLELVTAVLNYLLLVLNI